MDRCQQLISGLGLQEHPEGGYYRRMYSARAEVMPADDRPLRPALSSIIFLLCAGQFSRWHQLRSDEVWTWIEGSPLELRSFDASSGACDEQLLAAATSGPSKCLHGVAGGLWQSARSSGAYTLVSCCVAPAFEFSDFCFLRDDPVAHAALLARRADWQAWI
jgi:hypothetical protein